MIPPDRTPPPLPPIAIQIRLTRTGGREVGLLTPPDLTRAERLELIEWLAGAIEQHLEQPSPIVIHRGALPPT